MIDPVTFDQIVPNNGVVPVIRTPVAEAALAEDQMVLLNPLLYGFSLGDKIWGAFAASRLDKVNWNEAMVDSLVFSTERKDFIRDLVRHHGNRGDQGGFDDFVRDKGKGLIGLLAGPPGVGKTLTAEAVSEIAHRPLYMISSGELGETSSSVQGQLMRVMELAETWKAVVLLDEADVFLAERDDDSLSRNAIASIFLRHLEYYQGILLLTTNRLNSFDEAFQSRIHFCFEYGELDVSARKAIWTTFLDKAKTDTKVEIVLEEKDIAELAERELNGRQIKNIVSISHAVAAERKTPITRDSVMVALGFAKTSWKKKGEAASGKAPE
ncbi:P-loop containing nucleoside triphosphate hydrolase protein [Thozetella sp. PMI_491]|nr:P-loop containing nucleoside triphosphate hydrolase protein [Thozetella sp. PMI_491]